MMDGYYDLKMLIYDQRTLKMTKYDQIGKIRPIPRIDAKSLKNIRLFDYFLHYINK